MNTPLEQLKAVLCDQNGTVCINGSNGDRAVIAQALADLEGAQATKNVGYLISWFDGSQTLAFDPCDENDGSYVPVYIDAKPRADADDAMSSIMNRIEGWSNAYPLTVFPEPTDEQREWIHANAPGLMDRIAASMGRHMASCIASDLVELKAVLQGIPS